MMVFESDIVHLKDLCKFMIIANLDGQAASLKAQRLLLEETAADLKRCCQRQVLLLLCLVLPGTSCRALTAQRPEEVAASSR